MDLLTEAKLERRFRSSSRDLQRLYCGYYIVELLRTLTDDADAHPEVFDLAMEALEKIDGEGELSQTVFDFESGILKWLGHAPMLTRCVTCGINKTRIDRVHFGLSDGGLLCNECSRGKEAIRMLNSDSLQLLMDQFDVQLETNESDKTAAVTVSTSTLAADSTDEQDKSEQDKSEQDKSEQDKNDLSVKERASVYAADLLRSRKGYLQARQLMNQYMNHLVGHQIRLQKYIENL
jgi:DNA repair protein RecO (recombination protein O)